MHIITVLFQANNNGSVLNLEFFWNYVKYTILSRFCFS